MAARVVRTLRRTPVVAAVALAALGLIAPAADAAAPRKFANCTALTAVFPHGVGKPGARDHVSGHGKPITKWTHDAATYSRNTGLDRDKDGVACER
jgi:Excalibur calcium-binding domain